MMESTETLLAASSFQPLLTTKTFGRQVVEIHNRIDSTNLRGRVLGRSGAVDGTLILAETQTAGRGRLGRSWHSPSGRGLYFSLVLRPAKPLDPPALVTLAFGLGAAEALERTTGAVISVKWPNDLLLAERKAAGILVEMEWLEGRPLFLVAGVGVNVNHRLEDWPPDLGSKAGSLYVATGREWDRNRILADLLGGLERRYEDLLSGRQAALLADYRTRCSTLGAEVQVTSGDHRLFGRAADVDERGRLIVETDHQGRVPVEAGEVTLRV